jgi:hypothetical protein
MKIKQYSLTIAFYLFTIISINAVASDQDDYIKKFQNVALQECDTTFHQLEDGCNDMYCRDALVNAWAECWKKSMDNELNQRLLTLKSSNSSEFDREIALQKAFNQATHDLCGKSCGEDGDMKGIPYNFCRVDAYRYRTAQAIQINKNQLSIPIRENIEPSKSRQEKAKDTKFFNLFIEQLCRMPNDVWDTGSPPENCQNKAFLELNEFQFTNDVCDLS